MRVRIVEQSRYWVGEFPSVTLHIRENDLRASTIEAELLDLLARYPMEPIHPLRDAQQGKE